MNLKPWLPVIATGLVGTHLLSVKASQLRARLRHAPSSVAHSRDVAFGAMGPTRLWSSLATRMIHVVEEFTMIAISALFLASMVSLLAGV